MLKKPCENAICRHPVLAGKFRCRDENGKVRVCDSTGEGRFHQCGKLPSSAAFFNPVSSGCEHRGEKLRDVECDNCPSSKGKLVRPVFACSIHAECSSTRVAKGVQSCASCEEFEPTGRPIEIDSPSWAVGVATAPREKPTLSACLDSLFFNNFEVSVYAEPGSELPVGRPVRIVQNEKRKGCFHNWVSMLRDLLETNPSADRILTVQDDAAFAPGVKSFLESQPWPLEPFGMVSLYTAGHYQSARPSGLIEIGGRPFWGACAMLFPREVAEAIASHPLADSWQGSKDKAAGRPHLVANLDTFIGRVLDAMGLKIGAFNPSLSQHVATTSSLRNGGNGRKSGKWRRALKVARNPATECRSFPEPRPFVFKTYSELVQSSRRFAESLRGRIGAVAGVPRSGMIPAAVIAQELHVPMVPIESLKGGEAWRPAHSRELDENAGLPVLVVDDSVSRGGTIAATRVELDGVKDLIFAAIYVTERGAHVVDEFAEPIQVMHSFEWIVGRERHSERYAWDMDGVLCDDWSMGWETEFPEEYERHLHHAKPLLRPKYPVLEIITGRSERYRNETAAWLERNGIECRKLTMMDREPHERPDHAKFKSRRFKASKALLFVESCARQSERIAKDTGKAVLCWPEMRAFNC